ncbi:LacI family DNA-binding transcriptional regulator [Polycladomyces sp. WAk]|uniref:LacI family DNA-binding transcriptional regulator n=1 Tax=Polycladomyces zharkentensis TaxID=2807616 RepID=A0ABS2WLZ2_9BACL|nr:LacI family DNA-binding transcriptional regulator [Polycladomyces sp. WAk]MBN2910585.1 LacI family DNA-binding transcriptional regulator [Polycladomyces sp. WAk]
MATIRDVAKRAGVSVATVSRVLNETGYVHADTKAAVKKAIEELNYKPNYVARSLYQKSSRLIGLILPDITNPFFPELARAVEDVAHQYGYTVVLCNSDGDLEKEKHYLDVLTQNHADGLIVTTNRQNNLNYINLNIPVVALDRPLHESIPEVCADHYGGGKMATEYLIRRGCNFIAHVRGPGQLSPADERCRGFVNAAEKAGVPFYIVESQFDITISEQKVSELLDTYPRIDGIFAGNDLIAVAAVKVALKRGISIPEELQVIGFDGIPLSACFYPSITTIVQPIYEMGQCATKLLIQLITNQGVTAKKHCLPVKLVERETTKRMG